MENNVKVLKLITGEVVIARVEQKDTMLILDHPVILQPIPDDQESGGGYALAPWILVGKSENITISIDHVMAQDEAKPEVKKFYLESVNILTS